MKKNNKGFTLVELIIVIAIIAILAVVVAPQYLKYVENSRISTDMDTAAAVEQVMNVLVADGTITTSGTTITWNTDANGTIACSDTTKLAEVTALLNATAIPARSKVAIAAANVIVEVTFDTNTGTPTVKLANASANYKSWDPKAATTGNT